MAEKKLLNALQEVDYVHVVQRELISIDKCDPEGWASLLPRLHRTGPRARSKASILFIASLSAEASRPPE